MRSALKPMLNLKLLQSLIPMFNEKTKILVAELSKLNGSVHFNILPLSNLCAFNAICCEFKCVNCFWWQIKQAFQLNYNLINSISYCYGYRFES